MNIIHQSFLYLGKSLQRSWLTVAISIASSNRGVSEAWGWRWGSHFTCLCMCIQQWKAEDLLVWYVVFRLSKWQAVSLSLCLEINHVGGDGTLRQRLHFFNILMQQSTSDRQRVLLQQSITSSISDGFGFLFDSDHLICSCHFPMSPSRRILCGDPANLFGRALVSPVNLIPLCTLTGTLVSQ